jgi:hypothetical protein
MNNQQVFRPKSILKNAYLQSILASKRPGGKFSNQLEKSTQSMILTCPDNVKLSTYYSLQSSERENGCFILLHGWEGGYDSRYMKSATTYLFKNGYSIFRLNFRDHGNTYHLNEGLFFVTLFDEIFQAIQLISEMVNTPIYLTGYSLGANFALRIARKHSKTPIKGLKKILAIAPPIYPEISTDRIDQISLFRYYFLKKWLRSLKKKQSLFPHLYEFNDVFKLKTIRAITEVLVAKYTNHKDACDYFSHYTLLGDSLKDISIPTTIITASDDPIIPVKNFYELTLNKNINLIIHQHGGHIGYIENYYLQSWIDPFLSYWASSY